MEKRIIKKDRTGGISSALRELSRSGMNPLWLVFKVLTKLVIFARILAPYAQGLRRKMIKRNIKCMKFILIIFCVVLALSFTGCVSFAPPSPMVTYGGPQTTPEGSSEVAIAVGAGVALFEGAHSGGHGWFARYKYGLTKKLDLGIDAIGIVHSDKGTLTMKVASRYQLSDHIRLEGGIGAADDSDGKSINGDLAITVGTINKENSWNYYSSLRMGFAKGFAGNAAFSDNVASNDTIAPPDAMIC